MKKRILISLALCVALVALFAYVNVSAASKGTSDVDELKAQVTALEKRVSVLEEKMQRQPATSSVLVPQTFPESRELPKGWQKKKINGITYYLVPIRENQNK